MKNVKVYYGKELRDYIGSLWRTDEFKGAHNDLTSPIYKIVQEATEHPLFFYEMSDPLERTQFSTWWRHIQLRKYDIEAVNDLYLYHELCHIAKRHPRRGYDSMVQEEWASHAVSEELEASLESEVYVYWYLPTLRAKTFPFEIWADRFAITPNDNIESRKSSARTDRVRVLNDPNYDDPIEVGIHKYNNQNTIWCKYWGDVAYQIDREVANFKLMCGISPEQDINPCIIEKFQTFIADNTTDGVAFRKETRKFHEFTKESVITIFKA